MGVQPVITGNTDIKNPNELTPILKKQWKGEVSISGWFQTGANVEGVLVAKPDLILAGPTQEKIYDQLQKIAPTVMVPYCFNAFRDRFSHQRRNVCCD